MSKDRAYRICFGFAAGGLLAFALGALGMGTASLLGAHVLDAGVISATLLIIGFGSTVIPTLVAMGLEQNAVLADKKPSLETGPYRTPGRALHAAREPEAEPGHELKRLLKNAVWHRDDWCDGRSPATTFYESLPFILCSAPIEARVVAKADRRLQAMIFHAPSVWSTARPVPISRQWVKKLIADIDRQLAGMADGPTARHYIGKAMEAVLATNENRPQNNKGCS